MVKKEDWKTLEMPEQTETFILEKKLTLEDIELIKEGFRPQQMEDKWFKYYENGKLYIHRSWTGFCRYIIEISDTGRLNVIVNRNKEQHFPEQWDIDADKLNVEMLINALINKRKENFYLSKKYISRLQELGIVPTLPAKIDKDTMTDEEKENYNKFAACCETLKEHIIKPS